MEQIKRMEEDISDIKLQIGFLLSRFLEEEELDDEERKEIKALLGEVRSGNYMSKEDFLASLDE